MDSKFVEVSVGKYLGWLASWAIFERHKLNSYNECLKTAINVLYRQTALMISSYTSRCSYTVPLKSGQSRSPRKMLSLSGVNIHLWHQSLILQNVFFQALQSSLTSSLCMSSTVTGFHHIMSSSLHFKPYNCSYFLFNFAQNSDGILAQATPTSGHCSAVVKCFSVQRDFHNTFTVLEVML